jgi:hypothetical protein
MSVEPPYYTPQGDTVAPKPKNNCGAYVSDVQKSVLDATPSTITAKDEIRVLPETKFERGSEIILKVE